MEQSKPELSRQSPAEILTSTGSASLIVEYTPRRMRMLTLAEYELDDLASGSPSVHFALLGISFGALVAFGITLATVDIAAPRTFASFVALTAVSSLASLFFGANAIRGELSRRRRLRRLKQGL